MHSPALRAPYGLRRADLRPASLLAVAVFPVLSSGARGFALMSQLVLAAAVSLGLPAVAAAQYTLTAVPNFISNPIDFRIYSRGVLASNHDYLETRRITGGFSTATLWSYGSGTYSNGPDFISAVNSAVPSGMEMVDVRLTKIPFSSNGSFIVGGAIVRNADGTVAEDDGFVYSTSNGSATVLNAVASGTTYSAGQQNIYVNNSGVVAATTYANNTNYPWINYPNAATPILPAADLPEYQGTVYGLTNSGWVYGQAYTSPSDTNPRLFLYKGGDGNPLLAQPTVDAGGVLQPTPDPLNGTPVVPYFSQSNQDNPSPFINDLGTALFNYPAPGVLGWEYKIGQYRDSDQSWHTIDPGTLLQPFPTGAIPDDWQIHVGGIAADNSVAGTVSQSWYTDDTFQTYVTQSIPFRYDPATGSIVDLNVLLPDGSPTLTSVVALSSDGWMMGGTSDGSSYLIAPVPEPASLVISGIGCLGLVLIQSRWSRRLGIARQG